MYFISGAIKPIFWILVTTCDCDAFKPVNLSALQTSKKTKLHIKEHMYKATAESLWKKAMERC